MRPAYVYRAFDSEDRLLYVGATVGLRTRLRGHSKSSPWWLFHSYVVIDRFESHPAALEAEAKAIATEHPRWNVDGRSPEHPDGRISSGGGGGKLAAPWLRGELVVWREWMRQQREDAA